ncbi:alpha-galactosidase [Parerythrobacter aurantius]|uniref:alpha-galactosidase n=1 Tax=Parerythrobacter aurantius TaxID=3127706 RepID=UPI00324A51E0
MTKLHVLHSAQASIVLEHDPKRGVLWRHCGLRLEPGDLPRASEGRGPASFALDRDVGIPLVPPAGLGWFGPAAVELRDGQGAPMVFAPGESSVEESGNALSIACADPAVGLEWRGTFDALPGGAIRFSASLSNTGTAPVTLAHLASLQLPLSAGFANVISWRGRHNAELTECTEPMPQQRWEKVGRRGLSGHGGPPGLYVLGRDAGWHGGMTLAVQLEWSGDHSLAIERDDEGYWTLSAAAILAAGEVVLAPGERYTAPAALLALSDRGRNGAMAQMHAAVRDMLRWPGGTMAPRPVHLNSWEACYFDHDAGRIEALAQAGADVGIERFVLDDGWFTGRRHDRAGLGDWFPDPLTYPDGLAPLAMKIEAMGLQFGLWVEPEMINPDSDLYRAHPDWALAAPGRERPTARNQLVLDMRRKDVRDYLFERLDAVLKSAPIGYLKWDHNRDHAPSGGAAQVRGAYALLDRLRAAHPDVEIEGCAGGGGRSDAGLVPYVHRFWTSDNIDAVARVRMQRGFNAFLPPEIMGSHIGASPSHATGRSQSMSFRGAIASMGHLGVELDPAALDEADRAELASWIAFSKEWRHLLHGTVVALGEGSDSLRWQVAGTPGHKLLHCIRTSPPLDRRPQPLPLPFAASAEAWDVRLLAVAEEAGHGIPRSHLHDRMEREPVRYTGSWLAHAGLPLPVQKAESVAIFEMKEVH